MARRYNAEVKVRAIVNRPRVKAALIRKLRSYDMYDQQDQTLSLIINNIVGLPLEQSVLDNMRDNMLANNMQHKDSDLINNIYSSSGVHIISRYLSQKEFNSAKEIQKLATKLARGTASCI